MTRRNPTRRYSLASAIARTRGARTSTGLAGVRYHRDADVSMRVELALRLLNAAERQLRLAVRDALNAGERRARTVRAREAA
jgi:hypothetical protein